MNYNYTQPQYQNQGQMAYGSYRPPMSQYPQWSQPIATSTQVRPVSSIEEVKACPIDFDGSVFYFADIANKRIYTKQINLDGTVSISLYEYKENNSTTDQTINSSYVTKQEFEETLKQWKVMYEQLLNKIPTSSVEENDQSAAQSQQTPKAQFSF